MVQGCPRPGSCNQKGIGINALRVFTLLVPAGKCASYKSLDPISLMLVMKVALYNRLVNM